jgi:two-component system, NarL family, response regulator DegU
VQRSSDSILQPINVLVADSNQLQSQLLTTALRRRPDFSVNACALDPESILQALQQTQSGVVILNPSSQEDSDYLAAVRRIHLSYPGIPVILLLESYDRETVVNAFRSGVRGLFCFAEASLRSLCRCIQAVCRGQVWANSEQVNYLLDLVCQVPSLRVVNSLGRNLLTPREEQVVALVAEGLSNRDISNELNLSEHTIKKYLFRIYDKIGVSNRVELVLYAVAHGDTRAAEWVAAAAC